MTELRDGTFFAELTVSGPIGERRVDSRPSDAIALAVRVDAPLYVAGAVLDEAGAVLAETRDEEAIDEEVARFRSALDAFDPARDDTGDADPPQLRRGTILRTSATLSPARGLKNLPTPPAPDTGSVDARPLKRCRSGHWPSRSDGELGTVGVARARLPDRWQQRQG